MRILFTICGRAGSKGIKDKNIQDFLGKPLPLYTLSSIVLFLKENRTLDADIALNTDSQELVKLIRCSKMYEVEHIERKEALAGDVVSKIEVIRDTYIEMKKRRGCEYDMVLDMDITSPLRTVRDICNLVKEASKSKYDVVFTVTHARRNPYFNMVKKSEKGYVRVISSNYTARQQAPEMYDMNASMYAYKSRFLLSKKGMFDGYCGITEMLDTGILDLDHENDLELMQVIARYLVETRQEYAVIKNNI